jgi:hypothetical protein
MQGTGLPAEAATHSRAATEAEKLVSHLTDDEVQSLAALEGAPVGIAELAVATMPAAMRQWAKVYGIAAIEDTTAKLTDLGWQVIEEAARRCPSPYSEVSIESIEQSITDAVARLPAAAVFTRLPGGEDPQPVAQAEVAG